MADVPWLPKRATWFDLPDGLYVYVEHGIDPERFVDAFADSWRRMPAAVRRCLKSAWRPLSPWRVCPFFALVKELRVSGRRRLGYFLLRPHPYVFGWDATVLDRLTEDQAAAAIVHELGHAVYLAHCGRASSEREADQAVAVWGWGPAMRQLRGR
jgi:hypothetical protein